MSDDEQVFYRHEPNNMMPIEVVDSEHTSGVIIRSLAGGEPSNQVPVHGDELIGVAIALLEVAADAHD